MFNGKQVIVSNELLEGSEVYNQEYQKMILQENDRKTAKKQKTQNAAPKTRDLKKRLKSGRSLRILAIEHQSKINYIMPPAFTVCLYLGTEPWTGPRNLSDMMDFGEDEEGWKDFFADYQMNLICVNEIKDFSVFHTQLKLLLMLLAYREDKEKKEENYLGD